MKIAIIVVGSLLGALLIAFFTTLAVLKFRLQGGHNGGAAAFFTDAKNWLVAHRPSKRRLIQVYAAVLFNANIKGYITGDIFTGESTKYMCAPGLNCYSCPGAVAACPLGALQNALAGSGTRAPYYVLGILAIFGIMLARTICGFLCPVGLCQELLYKVRTPKLKKNRATRVFSYLKYVILALTIALPIIYATLNMPLPAFCKYICPAGTLEGAGLLLLNPNNADMFGQLGWQFTWKFCLAIAFVVASIFMFRFFCRFICPLGAIYGFFNRYALIGVKVDDKSCINCGLCVAHCKMDIKHVGDHECINCGECISVCPTKAISWKGSQIFLHKDAIDEQFPTVKPLIVENGTVKISQREGDFSVAQSDMTENVSLSAMADANAQMSVCTPVSETEVNIDSFKPENIAVKTAKRPKKSAKFWLEVTAWSLALVLLVTALVCYNVVDTASGGYTPPPPSTGDVVIGNNVGNTAPNFTVNLYDGQNGKFELNANRGKLTVINFWATWCSGCVAEMPYFMQLAEEYEDVTVLAIHGRITDDVVNYLNTTKWAGTDKVWKDSNILFAQDNLNDKKQEVTFRMLGGRSTWPMTVIVDEEGKVLYNSATSFHSYEQLKTLVTGFIAE